jgi:hypothetical protein
MRDARPRASRAILAIALSGMVALHATGGPPPSTLYACFEACGAPRPGCAAPAFSCICGDGNCDGVVDFDDIDAFAVALGASEEEYDALFPCCAGRRLCTLDVNGDCRVAFDDIDGFVRVLIGEVVCRPMSLCPVCGDDRICDGGPDDVVGPIGPGDPLPLPIRFIGPLPPRPDLALAAVIRVDDGADAFIAQSVPIRIGTRGEKDEIDISVGPVGPGVVRGRLVLQQGEGLRTILASPYPELVTKDSCTRVWEYLGGPIDTGIDLFLFDEKRIGAADCFYSPPIEDNRLVVELVAPETPPGPPQNPPPAERQFPAGSRFEIFVRVSNDPPPPLPKKCETIIGYETTIEGIELAEPLNALQLAVRLRLLILEAFAQRSGIFANVDVRGTGDRATLGITLVNDCPINYGHFTICDVTESKPPKTPPVCE